MQISLSEAILVCDTGNMATTAKVNRLLVEARKQPGVSDVMRVYGMAASRTRPAMPQPVIRVVTTASTAKAK